jgi:hypothetical protein
MSSAWMLRSGSVQLDPYTSALTGMMLREPRRLSPAPAGTSCAWSATPIRSGVATCTTSRRSSEAARISRRHCLGEGCDRELVVPALHGHAQIDQVEQRAATYFVRGLMSEQLVIEVACSGAIRIHDDIEATHQRLASRGREAHVRIKSDEQQAGSSDFTEPLFEACSGECSVDILLK